MGKYAIKLFYLNLFSVQKYYVTIKGRDDLKSSCLDLTKSQKLGFGRLCKQVASCKGTHARMWRSLQGKSFFLTSFYYYLV